ncbi:MAG: DUF4396 domain-containing protein, partial [Cyclobacteriaceae bacterium]|nr:DUF4396 domain-containing protein [Cyclobacteriaceae bacterium]
LCKTIFRPAVDLCSVNRIDMEIVKVNTNIHCDKCVNKLAPHLNGVKDISSWNFDLNKPEKTLTVQGEGITPDLIAELLDKEGYEIAPVVEKENSAQSFWSDISKWKRASFNTMNCLIGCSIGDFGMILFLQAFYPETSMAWQMVLAIIAGLFTSILLETMILKVRESFDWILALKTAFGMSFISMIGMEIAMNTSDFIITGGKASFDNPMYWIALIIAMAVGFAAPLPYNYYKLQKFNKACH